MDKNLRGKESEKCISQRNGGLYCARLLDRKRHEKYFSSFPEAQYADKLDVFM